MASKGKSSAAEVLRGPIKSKTVFPVLVLQLLEERPDRGLGLMQRIETICEDLLAVNTNTIYPLLRRLEERGFITGEWQHPTKCSRRYYAITPQGRERLERIKANMLPYLELLSASVDRLRRQLYDRTALTGNNFHRFVEQKELKEDEHLSCTPSRHAICSARTRRY